MTETIVVDKVEWKRKETTLTLNYRKQWGLWEAIREIEQNTLDETEDVCKFTKIAKDHIKLSDSGKGFTLAQFFLLGVSEKSSGEARGQYGEGLKIAQVILKRLGHEVIVRSRDWECRPIVEDFEGYQVITYLYRENLEPIKGSEIEIIGVDANKVKKLVDERILPTGVEIAGGHEHYGKVLKGKYAGKMYQRRIYVQDIHDKTSFGYDFYGVTLGTDRLFGAPWEIKAYTGILMQTITNPEDVDTLIEAFKRDTFEAQAEQLFLNDVFKERFIMKYGDRVISADETLRGKVSHNGRKMVKVQTEHIVRAFERIGIKSATTFLKEQDKKLSKFETVTFDELPTKKQRIFTKACEIIDKTEYFEPYTAELMQENNYLYLIKNKIDKRSFSMGNVYDGGKVYIHISCLTSIEQAVYVIVHEMIHLVKGHDDVTVEFESTLQEFQKALLTSLLEKEGVSFETKVYSNSDGKKFVPIPAKFQSKVEKNYYKVRLVNMAEG